MSNNCQKCQQLEEQLQQLRDKWLKSLRTQQEIIKRQARAIQISREIHIKKNPSLFHDTG